MTAASLALAAEPEEITVKRFRCPFCHRSRSKRQATAEHIDRCWTNPAVRSCKTCVHFKPIDCCGMPDVHECYTPACPTAPTCAAEVEIPEDGSMVTGCPSWAAEAATS